MRLLSAVTGIALLTIVGCGNRRTPESMMKEYVEFVNAEAAEYEIQAKNASPASVQESIHRLEKVQTDRKAVFDELEKLPKGEYFAVLSKHQLEMKRANARLRFAKDAKIKAANK